MLNIVLNGEETTVPVDSSLLDLLTRLGRDPRTVAIEHNGEIVRREAFAEQRLAAGDQLEVVHFVQGGACLSPEGRLY